jgi:hypothetical protein
MCSLLAHSCLIAASETDAIAAALSTCDELNRGYDKIGKWPVPGRQLGLGKGGRARHFVPNPGFVAKLVKDIAGDV